MARQTSYYQPINVNLRPQDVDALELIINHLEDVNGTTGAVRHALLLAAAQIERQQQESDDE